jgi:hypothetical protein
MVNCRRWISVVMMIVCSSCNGGNNGDGGWWMADVDVDVDGRCGWRKADERTVNEDKRKKQEQ